VSVLQILSGRSIDPDSTTRAAVIGAVVEAAFERERLESRRDTLSSSRGLPTLMSRSRLADPRSQVHNMTPSEPIPFYLPCYQTERNSLN
jgi:hypothetical protein